MIWSNRALKVEKFEFMYYDCYGIPMGNEGILLCGLNVLDIRFAVRKGQILDENSISVIPSKGDDYHLNIVNRDIGLSLLISTQSEYDEKLAHGYIKILDGQDSLKMLSRGCGRNDRQNQSGDYSDCWIEYLLSVTGNAAIAVRKSGIVDDHEAWYVILVHDFTTEYIKKDNVLKHSDNINRHIPEQTLQKFIVEDMKKDDVVNYFKKIDKPLPAWINEDGSFAEGYPKYLSTRIE